METREQKLFRFFFAVIVSMLICFIGSKFLPIKLNIGMPIGCMIGSYFSVYLL